MPPFLAPRVLALSAFAGLLLGPALAAAQPGPEDTQPSRSAPAVPASASGPAGDGATTPWETPPQLVPAPRPVTRPDGSRRKDPGIAGWTSGLVTASGLGLLIVAGQMSNYNSDGSSNSAQNAVGTLGTLAFVIGPTTGHIYAGEYWNTGLGIRIASAVAMTIGVGMALQCLDGCASGSSNDTLAPVLIIGGMAGYGIGMVYEIGTAPGAARAYNHAHGLDAQLSLLPVRDARNAAAPAVGLVGHF